MQVTFLCSNQKLVASRTKERTNSKTTFDSFFFQGYLFLKTVLQNASFFISHKMQSFREWKMFLFFKRTFQNMENNGGYFECSFI
jgi:hypothetical protein